MLRSRAQLIRGHESIHSSAIKPTFHSILSRAVVWFCSFLITVWFSNEARAVSIGESTEVLNQEDLRLDHRVAAGLMVGGPAGLFGIDTEVNISESLSAGLTVGTGVDYSTFGVRGRFYVLAKYINPFVGFHYMYWWSERATPRPGDINPRAIVEDLLTPSQLARLPSGGFNLHMIAPEIGIQFFSNENYAFSGSFLYLANIAELRAAPYGQITVSWYF